MSEQNKNNRKNNRSRWLYGRITPDRLTEVLAELLQEEPDYNAIIAEAVGCSMADWQRGEYSVDDSGDDFGDDLD